jgi:ribosomal protein L28
MSKECTICGKTSMAGRSIQHKHSVGWRYKAPRSKRTFNLNLREVNLDVDGKIVKAPICMKCYKKLRKESEIK